MSFLDVVIFVYEILRVIAIEDGAFANSALTTIEISYSVIAITDFVFANKDLEKVITEGIISSIIFINSFENSSGINLVKSRRSISGLYRCV